MYSTVLHIVGKRKVSVFFIEIMTYVALDKDSSRTEADNEMRKRFIEFASGRILTPQNTWINRDGHTFLYFRIDDGE